MKIFVTGATGFVGGHLCKKLYEQGHQIWGLVRSEKKFQSVFNHNNDLITPIYGSLKYDEKNQWIDELPQDLDLIIHTAGIVHAHNPDDFFNINTRATQQLNNDLHERYSKLNYILISSLAAAGPGDKAETDLLTPVSKYGESKKQAEACLIEPWNNIIIRPPMVIGPGDPAVLDVFKMVKGQLIITTGKDGKNNHYSFINVFDLVDGIIEAKKYLFSNHFDRSTNTFFLAHDTKIKFHEMIDLISMEMNKKTYYLAVPIFLVRLIGTIASMLNLDLRLTKDKVNELIPNSWCCKNQRSKSVLKLNYNRDLKETIKMTFKDYKERGWI